MLWKAFSKFFDKVTLQKKFSKFSGKQVRFLYRKSYKIFFSNFQISFGWSENVEMVKEKGNLNW